MNLFYGTNNLLIDAIK